MAQSKTNQVIKTSKFTEDDICRSDIPRDAFVLIHDLAYDHDGRDRRVYRRRAREILTTKLTRSETESG